MDPYDIANDPYVNKQSGILRNKLGLHDALTLETVETQLVSAQVLIILNESIPARFDSHLLRSLHWRLFHQLYDWAGEYRTVEISKGSSRFAMSEHIPQQVDIVLAGLENKCTSWKQRNCTIPEVVAHFYSELNAIHPFREGNGRTIRLFLLLLAIQHGWFVDWKQMTPEENITASQAAFYGNEALLKEIVSRISSVLPEESRRQSSQSDAA